MPICSPISAAPEELQAFSSTGSALIAPRWTSCWRLQKTKRAAFAPTLQLLWGALRSPVVWAQASD
jgi:hypothetical protein